MRRKKNSFQRIQGNTNEEEGKKLPTNSEETTNEEEEKKLPTNQRKQRMKKQLHFGARPLIPILRLLSTSASYDSGLNFETTEIVLAWIIHEPVVTLRHRRACLGGAGDSAL